MLGWPPLDHQRGSKLGGGAQMEKSKFSFSYPEPVSRFQSNLVGIIPMGMESKGGGVCQSLGKGPKREKHISRNSVQISIKLGRVNP